MHCTCLTSFELYGTEDSNDVISDDARRTTRTLARFKVGKYMRGRTLIIILDPISLAIRMPVIKLFNCSLFISQRLLLLKVFAGITVVTMSQALPFVSFSPALQILLPFDSVSLTYVFDHNVLKLNYSI